MSYGIGTDISQGWGEADSWGGPMNGVDVVEHISGASQKASAKVSEDTYLFLTIIVALGLLWLLGGFTFRSARA